MTHARSTALPAANSANSAAPAIRPRPAAGPPAGRPPVRRDTRRPGERGTRGARPAPTPVRRDARRPHHWFAQQLMLVLSAQRPVNVLFGHADAAVLDALIRLAPSAPLRPSAAAIAGSRTSAAPRTGAHHATGGPADPAVPALAGLGVQFPRPGVAEVFARVAVCGRQRALAFRLEAVPGSARWRCTALELGGLA